MRPEFIEPRRQPDSFDLSAFTRDVVLSGILAVTDDKAEMNHRIMLARQCGFVSDEETAAWIAEHGLKHA